MKNAYRVVMTVLLAGTALQLFSGAAFAQVLKGAKEQQRNSAMVAKTPPPNAHLLTDDEFQRLLTATHVAPMTPAPGRVIRNPKAASAEMTLFNQLSQQKQSADSDLLRIRAAHPKQLTAAQPAGGMLNSRMATATGVRTSATMQSPASAGTIGPGTVERGQTGASRYATMPAMHVSPCPFSNGQVAIGKMTGSGPPMTFTPIPQYNLYTIHGCNFGEARPGTAAWIYGPGFHADFHIEEWSDDSIVLSLGTNISGVLDQSNLHLVVHRADGKEAQADGYKFYAARTEQPVLLRYVPPAWRKLDINVTGQHHWNQHPSLQSNSPTGGPNVPKDAANTSIYVHRHMGEKFSPGSDTFDLSQLPPGWVVDSVMWNSYPAPCSWVVTYRQDFGQWNVDFEGSTVKVQWSDTSCSGFCPIPVWGFPSEIYQDQTDSSYSLLVYVKGPRGTENLLPHM